MIVEAAAPVRIADCGGWTDTWFAGTGLVCSVAVVPGAWVRIGGGRTTEIVVESHNASRSEHPLLWAAVDACRPYVPARIEVGAGVPPGCAMGTSAAVVVAMLAALEVWNSGFDPAGGSGAAVLTTDRGALAAAAHAVETGLGWQSGVQDQQAAAWGGISLIAMESFPLAARRIVVVPDHIRSLLDQLLVTVYLGRPHRSSAVHDTVIASLDTATPSAKLIPLRSAARDAASALEAGDLVAYGRALTDNTEAQRDLHPDLVSDDANVVIERARAHGALGWKVNGAGGSGGTVTVLLPDDPSAFMRLLDDTPFSVLDLRLADDGVRVRVDC